jgi:hypothetical protein
MFEQKEEMRKVYDHYEHKLEALIRDKENKIKKGSNINDSFTKKLQRVILFINT